MAVSQGLDERAGTQKTRRLLKPHVARKNSRYTGLAGKEKGDAELRRSSEVQHSQDQRRAARMLAFGHQEFEVNQHRGASLGTPSEPMTLGAMQRTETTLDGAAKLGRALQRCIHRFQMTIMVFWKEALEDTVVQTSGGPSFEGPFRPMGSMCSLSSVQMEDDVELQHWQLLSSLEEINESTSSSQLEQWLRRKRLARVSAAWHALAAGHSAKRLIKKVCAQFHIQALVRKSFVALLQHSQKARARQMALMQVVDQLLEEKLLQHVVKCFRLWRSKAAKGSILRRGGLVLKRFLDASCLRRWLSTWMANVVRAKRISERMAVLEDKLHSVQRAKVLKAWRRVSRSARAAHQVLEQKQLQLVQILMKRWASTWRAARYERLRLSAKCWRGFHDEVRRKRAAALVRSRCQDLDARAGLLRWGTAISLRTREAELRQIVQVRALRVTVQRWYRLKASKALQVTRILRSYLQGWSAITGHLLCERRQREIENFGTGPGAAPTEWQSRQRRRWQGRCWTPWVQVVQRKRQRRRRIKEAKEDLKKLVSVQALRFWHCQSASSALRKEHLRHASMALMAMVSACRWARAHDCLVYWFTRTQARRIMCKETDLSGETLPLLQPLPSMFAAPVAEMPDSSPWNLRPSVSAPPWPMAPWSYPSSHSARSARSARSGDRSGDRCSGPSEILLMSDDEVVDPAMSVSTTLAPVELLCSKMKRWLRLAFLLWQQAELNSAATSLPILQWSWSFWRQSRLRAQVHPLRWWSLALQMHKLRELELRLDFRRLRRTLKAWYDAVAESLKEAVEAAQEELSSCRALFQDLNANGRQNGAFTVQEPSEVGILEPVTSKDLVS